MADNKIPLRADVRKIKISGLHSGGVLLCRTNGLA